ncbi:hypothetical protein LN650_21445 [Klebsiella pneumoniae subsp. pneumoniae]|nr:hypothetical protein [Klebsiella pneumoniae subsp. pneumoniae]
MDELKAGSPTDSARRSMCSRPAPFQYNQALQALERAKALVPSAGSDPGERRRVAGNLPGERAGSDGENAVAGTENERGANRAQPVLNGGLPVGGGD